VTVSIERFRAAVSVFIGPCCPAVLESYLRKCAYCCIIEQIKLWWWWWKRRSHCYYGDRGITHGKCSLQQSFCLSVVFTLVGLISNLKFVCEHFWAVLPHPKKQHCIYECFCVLQRSIWHSHCLSLSMSPFIWAAREAQVLDRQLFQPSRPRALTGI